MSLRKISLWMMEPFEKMEILLNLIKNVKDLKGGMLISNIYHLQNNGNSNVKNFLTNIIQYVTGPYMEMIKSWISFGNFQDPFDEFFIYSQYYIEEKDLWKKKYSIRNDMMPSYISQEMAKKILCIGKSINFLHSIEYTELDINKSNIQNIQNISQLESICDILLKNMNQLIMNLLIKKYHLTKHLSSIKDYLLLGDGELAQFLLDNLK